MGMIGKRRGTAAKGAGSSSGDKIGGSLSKSDHLYLTDAFGLEGEPGAGVAEGIAASGGVETVYESPTSPGTWYKSHSFSSSGTFTITKNATPLYPTPNNVDILLIGGGGAGGFGGGGGGAGGFVEVEAMPLTTVPGPSTWTVTIGGGGAASNSAGKSGDGGDTTLTNPTNPEWIKAYGGGGGMSSPSSATNPGGGSGGGCSHTGGASASNPGPATQPAYSPPISLPAPILVTNVGNPGGDPSPPPAGNYFGSGGGGAGGQGSSAANPNDGGPGKTNEYGNGVASYYAGGGGGGNYEPPASADSQGGLPTARAFGSNMGKNSAGSPGLNGTGSGGGGGGGGLSYYAGGKGASGICVIRYQVDLDETPTDDFASKATGGTIQQMGPLTVHTFTGSGTFTNVSGSPLDIDYICVAGGGSGHYDQGAGGGAGGVLTNIPGLMPSAGADVTVGTAAPNAITVTVGSGGAYADSRPLPGNDGGDSSLAGPFGSTLTAIGGGAGGTPDTAPYGGRPGGSGGGGRGNRSPNEGGEGTSGQGNSGGDGGSGVLNQGGGGGAGSSGGNAGTGPIYGGGGGAGVILPTAYRYFNTGLAAVSSGLLAPGPGPSNYWFAGGGGGSGSSSQPTTNPNGGNGPWGGTTGPTSASTEAWSGGGNGTFLDPTQSALSNRLLMNGMKGTGGGGGGQYDGGSNRGGAGGDGMVIISYPT